MPDPVALVLGVVAGYLARTHPLRWPDLLHALLARLIHTDHRMGRIVRPGIHFQHVLHRAHEGSVLLWRDTPHLLSPRLELVFFNTLRTVSCDIERTTRRRFKKLLELAQQADHGHPGPSASHSICSVHRVRPTGASLQAIATNCASPSPSSTVARSRLRLPAFQRSREAVLYTTLTHLLDRLWSDPHLLPYRPCRRCPGPCSPWSANSGSAHSAGW